MSATEEDQQQANEPVTIEGLDPVSYYSGRTCSTCGRPGRWEYKGVVSCDIHVPKFCGLCGKLAVYEVLQGMGTVETAGKGQQPAGERELGERVVGVVCARHADNEAFKGLRRRDLAGEA
jgi:hypothetical protein